MPAGRLERPPGVPVNSFAPPEVLADHVEAAKRAGTFGRLKKRRAGARRPNGPQYAVTCGGCAIDEDLGGFDRRDAIAESRERGWRTRSVPGVPTSRYFCVDCQDDMDSQSRIYIEAGEDPEPARARWRDGNPFRLPSGSRKGPGPAVGASPGPQGDLSTTVELYRGGQLKDFPYDLEDPLDRAAFRALQTYSSHLETLRVAQAGFAVPPNRRPLRLEQDLRRLMLWRRNDLELTAGERWALARSILETMFAPLSSSGARREGFVVGKEFFDSGGVPRARPAGEALPGVPEPDDRRRLDPVATTAPLDLFYDGLAPLSAALRDALGEHVSQSDAARVRPHAQGRRPEDPARRAALSSDRGAGPDPARGRRGPAGRQRRQPHEGTGTGCPHRPRGPCRRPDGVADRRGPGGGGASPQRGALRGPSTLRRAGPGSGNRAPFGRRGAPLAAGPTRRARARRGDRFEVKEGAPMPASTSPR